MYTRKDPFHNPELFGVLRECGKEYRNKRVCRCEEWVVEPEGSKHGVTVTATAMRA